jgi:hypothetical protein
MKVEKTQYSGWNALRLSTPELEAIVTLDVGPRVIHLAVPGRRNLFAEFPDHKGVKQGKEWLSFGGHRLWHAPEVFPRTYEPDFDPVPHQVNGQALELRPKTETGTGLRKEIDISLEGNRVHLVHRLVNHNVWDVEVAAWCLSVMAPGGTLYVPQEPYFPHPDVLTPARPLVLWPFTNMADPRFTWGEKLIQMRERGGITKQKFGLNNSLGWAAYHVEGDLFLKTFPRLTGVTYPDLGCNCEFFTMPGFLEVETLGPLVRLAPGQALTHEEDWKVFPSFTVPSDESKARLALEGALS